MIHEIETYRDLLCALQSMSGDQLDQVVQVADEKPDGSPVAMMKCLAIGTVAGFEFDGARSVNDNRYHAEEVVLLVDCNPFGEDGAVAYRLEFEEGDDGRHTAQHHPIYTSDGPTPPEAQLAPKDQSRRLRNDLVLKSRLRRFHP